MTACFPTCETCGGSGEISSGRPPGNLPEFQSQIPCPVCVQGVVITDELRERVARAVAVQYSTGRDPWYAENPGEYIARMRLESAGIVDAVLTALVPHLKEKGTER